MVSVYCCNTINVCNAPKTRHLRALTGCSLQLPHNPKGARGKQAYAKMRKEAAVSQGMPVAVRHLEAMIRMAEAHAAMHLREYVNAEDIDLAIKYGPGHKSSLYSPKPPTSLQWQRRSILGLQRCAGAQEDIYQQP